MWKAVAISMITLGVAACAPVSTTPYPTTTPVYRTPPAMLVERPSVFYTPKSVEELKLMNKKQLIDEIQGACNDAISNNQRRIGQQDCRRSLKRGDPMAPERLLSDP